MVSGERQVVLIVADISGYTRFMVSNRETLHHAQAIITELIKAIVRQIEIPLQIAKLEGDAVFLYAVRDEDAASWDDVRRQIGLKLVGFFEAFSRKVAELSRSNTCGCVACQHVDQLRLKIVMHSGRALFYDIGSFQELSGVDVILVHRLLKNSLSSDQYILMTEPAYRDVAFPHEVAVVEGQETYEHIGPVKTYVYYPESQALLFVPMPEPLEYASPRYKAKNGMSKLFHAFLTRLGLRQVPQFTHLPDL
jgi:hypothetical protein